MLPDRKLNIYPNTDENLQALINFYFSEFNEKGALDEMKQHPQITLNQWEFIFKKIIEAYQPVFQRHLNPPINLSNLIAYGVDGTRMGGPSRHGSMNRRIICREFKDFVIRTQAV